MRYQIYQAITLKITSWNVTLLWLSLLLFCGPGLSSMSPDLKPQCKTVMYSDSWSVSVLYLQSLWNIVYHRVKHFQVNESIQSDTSQTWFNEVCFNDADVLGILSSKSVHSFIRAAITVCCTITVFSISLSVYLSIRVAHHLKRSLLIQAFRYRLNTQSTYW